MKLLNCLIQNESIDVTSFRVSLKGPHKKGTKRKSGWLFLNGTPFNGIHWSVISGILFEEGRLLWANTIVLGLLGAWLAWLWPRLETLQGVETLRMTVLMMRTGTRRGRRGGGVGGSHHVRGRGGRGITVQAWHLHGQEIFSSRLSFLFSFFRRLPPRKIIFVTQENI